MTLQKSLFFFVGESSFVVRSDPLICYFKQSTLFSFISTTRVLFSFLASQSYIEPAYSRLIDLLDNWSRIIAGYFCYFKKRKNTVLSTAAARGEEANFQFDMSIPQMVHIWVENKLIVVAEEEINKHAKEAA
uniref:Uncharacterized protein LOC104216106 n=1 Tax=Nicotiana sylvestris TaxID=4096 RepID=A0A1U7VHJ0_NICSY|nr:PREDICTED: uncharacterized protein LOC104216106 [Nicotiana sylvestris]